MIMNVIAWIAFGATAGWLAHLITDSDQSRDAIDDITVGIVGALIGGFMGSSLFGTSLTAFDIRSLVAAGLGSAVLLLVITSVRRPHTSV